MKKLIALVFLAVSLTGCETMPQNVGAGALLGGVFGAIAGDSRHAAERGAIAGAVIGALIPTQPRSAGPMSSAYAPAGAPNCTRHSDGARTFARSDEECRSFSQGGSISSRTLSGDSCPSGYRQESRNGRTFWQCQEPQGTAFGFRGTDTNSAPNCTRRRDGAQTFARNDEECRAFSQK